MCMEEQSTPEGDDNTDPPRVYLDAMLGSLATLLRMAGWDAAYALDRGVEADGAIQQQAEGEGRVLITRDRQLADRTPGSVLLTAKDVNEQVEELRHAGFSLALDEPTRCSSCNGLLQVVPAEAGTPDHAPSPENTVVWECRDCGQHFWEGSHWDDARSRLATSSDESVPEEQP